MTEITANRAKQNINKQSIVRNKDIQEMITKFMAWLEKAGYESYDPYDIWGTGYGLLARRVYYSKNPLGLVLTAPVLLMEMVCPSLRSLFVKKERFATADAQLILGFLNLHKTQRANELGLAKRSDMKKRQALKLEDIQGNDKISWSGFNYQKSNVWLSKAKILAEDLLSYSIPGFSGYCWGYPFEWQHSKGRIPKSTPLITTTPYCLEAFLKLFDVTGEDCYLDIARSIANFVYNDLNDTPVDGDAMAGSYSPYDHGKVINASAYRSFVLFTAARRFCEEAYADKAWGNLKFILQSQRQDGSWLYAIDSPTEAFIDHFHTCFVLKNLYKINLLLNDNEVMQAIERGYEYYHREFFDNNGLPKSFVIEPRIQISKLEMYNVAEAISLGAILRDHIPEAFALANELALLLGKNFQHRRGFFITRVYIGNIKHMLPFLRWPQAQLFYALTNILMANNADNL